jgi:hypothetical protein
MVSMAPRLRTSVISRVGTWRRTCADAAEAEQWARARGLREFGSDTGVDNEVSIAAHRALGFRENDRIVQFLKPLNPD